MEVDGGATGAVFAPSPVADSACAMGAATARCAVPESELVGDEDASRAFTPSTLVASWPARSSSEGCGWTLFHRLADWAVHQARWFDASSIRRNGDGAAGLGVAT
eukprot:2954758-Alexandrium_andersonii.AAC.1